MKKYLHMLRRDWKRGKYLDFFLYLTIPIITVSFLLLFLTFVLVEVIKIMQPVLDVLAGIAIIVIGIYLYNKKTFNIPKQADSFAEVEIDSVQESLNINYQIIEEILFSIIRRYYPILKVQKVERPEDLDSICKTKVIGKHIVLYEYILYKTGSNDINTIKQLIENFIVKEIKRGGLVGFTNQYYLYKGTPVAILQLHEIEDFNSYYKVTMVLVNDSYCNYLKGKVNTNLASGVDNKVHFDEDF